MIASEFEVAMASVGWRDAVIAVAHRDDKGTALIEEFSPFEPIEEDILVGRSVRDEHGGVVPTYP